MSLKNEAFNEYLFGAGHGVGLPDEPEGKKWFLLCFEDEREGREILKDKRGNEWFLEDEKFYRRLLPEGVFE